MEEILHLDTLSHHLQAFIHPFGGGGERRISEPSTVAQGMGCGVFDLETSRLQNLTLRPYVPDWINGDRINGLFHLFINGLYWVYNPLILTFDPNFLGHPSI